MTPENCFLNRNRCSTRLLGKRVRVDVRRCLEPAVAQEPLCELQVAGYVLRKGGSSGIKPGAVCFLSVGTERSPLDGRRVTHPRISGIGTANPALKLTQEESFIAAGVMVALGPGMAAEVVLLRW
jgi:hypothetical protein